MSKFLIEITHPDDEVGCLTALDAIMKHGSHLITQADFGCTDGVHCGWLIADVDNRTEAMQIVPPEFRSDARVVELRRWSREEIEDLLTKAKA